MKFTQLYVAVTVITLTAIPSLVFAQDDVKESMQNTSPTKTANILDDDSSATSVTAGNAFNPKISVVLDGVYVSSPASNGYQLTGQQNYSASHVEEASTDSGFTLGESEIMLESSIDQYLDGRLTLAMSGDGASAEEAWFKTRMLPFGLTVKAGQLMSGIAYHNDKHAHMWEFSDSSLPYQAFLGAEGIKDTGIQLTWLPNIDTYIQVGIETFKGKNETGFASHVDDSTLNEYGVTSKETRSKPNIATTFIRVSPELSGNHTLQLGAWTAYAENSAIIYQPTNSGNQYLVQGKQWLSGISAVYKWDSSQLLGQGDVKLIAEVMQARNKNSHVMMLDNGDVAGEAQTQTGYSLEGSYGFAPRWQSSLRIDGLQASHFSLGQDTLSSAATNRVTAAISFKPSEFSRFRLQASQGQNAATADMTSKRDTQMMLQYTMSFGSHPAHSF